MRLGVMIGAERGDMARKVDQAGRRHRVGGVGGPGHRVDAAGARRLRLPDDGGADGRAHLAHRTRHRRGAAAGAASDRPCPPGTFGARRWRRAGWRSVSGRRTTGSSATCSACPTRSPPPTPATTSRCSTPRSPGPGAVDVENDSFTVHNPTVLGAETPMPVLVAALGPVMLQIAGEHADGTVLWMADEKAIGDHIAPQDQQGRRRGGPAGAAHRRGYPGVPVRQLRDRRGQGPGQPHPGRGRDVAELPEAARPRRRPQRRRPVCRR